MVVTGNFTSTYFLKFYYICDIMQGTCGTKRWLNSALKELVLQYITFKIF